MEMPNIVPDLTGPESQKARKPERNEPEGDLALASTWGKAALRMPVAVLVRVPATHSVASISLGPSARTQISCLR
jgi:hypothetical protein